MDSAGWDKYLFGGQGLGIVHTELTTLCWCRKDVRTGLGLRIGRAQVDSDQVDSSGWTRAQDAWCGLGQMRDMMGRINLSGLSGLNKA